MKCRQRFSLGSFQKRTFDDMSFAGESEGEIFLISKSILNNGENKPFLTEKLQAR